MNRWVAMGWVLLATPLLQGAGCSAHHTPRFKGTVQPDEPIRYAHSGHKVVIVFRQVGEGHSKACDDWTSCLLEDGWTILDACGGKAEPGQKATVAVSEGQASIGFEACPGMIGVDYRADVAAFIDLDDDGKPSAGEPYGAFKDGPMTRDLEKERIIIRIAETLP